MAKIAIISTMGGYAWGGSEYLWAAMAKEALAEKHEILISVYDWSTTHPLMIELQQQGAKIFPRNRKKPFYRKIIQKLSQSLSFLRFLSVSFSYYPIFESNPDIIYISCGSIYEIIYDFPLLQLLELSSINYVIINQLYIEHLILKNTERILVQKLFAKAAKVIFVSKQNLQIAERQLVHSLPNAMILQNPVNLSDFHLLPFLDQSTVYLASVARLDAAYKGQDILFETLSLPQWQDRNWHCRLYGSGPDQSYLKSLAEYYNIVNRVQFMGHICDVRSIWRENHLLVLPSRAEGTPLALVEAMLCGRPVVVTDVGGNTEWIEEAQTGFIADAPTVKSFSVALEKAWLARSHWQTIGTQAHQMAIAHLDKNPGKSLLRVIDKYL
ncbi:glycosyltransferase family 4 protein [Tolypothrix sp. PCC 7910]|uniref:glycosyltransferase n=1 Tax=Tolypothrix sp. PCC 7910 TaxID=2099387 RepID=UPI0014277EB5|nr:glycosyltransferase [Tolypothrix sp. PCC 7910]QIR37181.1 glycosyltransferase family 4 protein [Tolypothrix sp. PCC 7910]